MKRILLCLLLLLTLTSLFACDAQPEGSDPKSEYTDRHTEKSTQGNTQKPTETDAHQCKYALTESKASTCAEAGYEIYGCACGKTRREELALSDDHSFGAYIPDGNATCVANGTKTAKCELCGAEDTVSDGDSLASIRLEIIFQTATETAPTRAPKPRYVCSAAQRTRLRTPTQIESITSSTIPLTATLPVSATEL